jgi:hypothetical protein
MHHRRTGNGHSNLGSLISGIYGKIDRTHWRSQQIIPKQKLASGLYPIEFDWRYDTKTEYYGLTFASGESSSIWANPQTITFRTNTIGVPFAYIVIPLLSVSAWLLLSRSQPAKSTTEPPV